MAESKSKVPVYENLAKIISREGPSDSPPFPIKLHVMEHVRGEPIIYEEMDGEVLQRRSEKFVAQQILMYCSRTLGGRILLDAREATNAAKFWEYNCLRLETEVLPVAQKSEIGFNYHRLPWDFADGPTPTWDEMFARLENADAIRAWIGSLFEPRSDRQQYCWIHGEGGDGKGALNRFLKAVFNGAYKPETVPTRNDKFWTSSLMNARIIVFPDCNNYNFPTTGLFKQITGDDPVKVEFKNEPAFSVELVCKMLFLSNQRANISGQRSDTRRAIFAEIAPVTGAVIPTRVYDAMLWKEGAAFLYKCAAKYRELCPEHGPVPVDERIVARLVEANEEDLEVITLRNFRIEPDEFKFKNDRDRWFVSPCRLHSILDHLKIEGDSRRRYLEFLKRKFGVERIRVRLGINDDAGREYRYIGFREDDQALANVPLGSPPQRRPSLSVFQGSLGNKGGPKDD